MKSLNNTLCAALMALLPVAAWAQAAAPAVRVDGAWARASVQGQTGTGAFMTLTSRDPLKLVAVASPAAGLAELHEMKVEGDVMRMRAIDALDLPAGKPVELKPGSYHVMLLDLKAPLMKDSMVPLTLVFRDAKGAESRMQLQLPVGVRAPAPMDGRK